MFSIRGKGLAPFAELFLHSDELKPVAAIVLRLGVVSCNAQREVCRTYSTPRMQVFNPLGLGYSWIVKILYSAMPGPAKCNEMHLQAVRHRRKGNKKDALHFNMGTMLELFRAAFW